MGGYSKLNPDKKHRIALDIGISLTEEDMDRIGQSKYMIISPSSIFFRDNLDLFFVGRNRKSYKVFELKDD